MVQKDFTYGNKPSMKEVPAGTEAIFSFNGEPTVEETQWGDKYSFPISLISHDSYLQELAVNDGPLNMDWQSKSTCAKQLYLDLTEAKDATWHKDLVKFYNNNKWQLTRFDGGAYYISVLK